MTEQTDIMRAWPTEDVAAANAEAGDGTLRDVPLDEHGMPTVEAMRTALKAVMDPEIGIDIVNLGLVYDLDATEGKATVEMTLTSMGCPLTELIHQQCTLVLTRLPGITEVDVNFVFSPPWSTDMISDDARDELRAMGFGL